MLHAVQFRPDPRNDAQFLPQLARERGLERLAGLDLAAGKFPQQLESGAAPPLAHKQLAFVFDERCDHGKHG
jgi:hypothetical protein